MNIDKMQELLREFVGNVSKLKLYDEKNFAFVSYAHTTEAEHVYTTLIELALDGYLFAADISYKDSTESWVMEMTEKVASSGCKCMINFIDMVKEIGNLQKNVHGSILYLLTLICFLQL